MRTTALRVTEPRGMAASRRARLAAPLLLLALAAPVDAAQLFSAPFLTYDTGLEPSAIAVADLNGDGLPDLVTANQGGTISVLLGNGDGTFPAHAELGTGLSTLAVAIADLNGDGRLDVVAVNKDSNTISVFLGNGDGTFGPRADFGTGRIPQSVAIADVNGDGRPDLAVANQFSNSVSVLLGNGDGTFRPRTDFVTGNQPLSAAIADLNGDGRPDLAVANYNLYPAFQGSVSVLLGNGDGTFRPRTDFKVGGDPLAVAIGDLNGDGRPDLAVTGVVELLAVLFGNGDGTFGPPVRLDSHGARSLTIGDVNTDGRLDLVTATGRMVSVVLGNGDGTFGPSANFDAGYGPWSVAIADVDADGRPDLVAPTGYATVAVLHGNGDGTFGTKIASDAGSNPGAMAIADFNADGRPDLAVVNMDDDGYRGAVSVLLGYGDGRFGIKANYEAGGAPVSVAAADFDADGHVDLALVNVLPADDHLCTVPGMVRVLLGNGDGTFRAGADFVTVCEPTAMAVGDLNADGHSDLVLKSHDGGVVSALLGNGDGTFQDRIDHETGGIFLTIGDLNRDGRLDIVTSKGFSLGTFSVLLGNGDGTFGAGTEMSPGGTGLAIADFDADGRQDLAMSNPEGYAHGTVSLLPGNGDGTFGARTDFLTGRNPYSVGAADFDSDGRLDLAVVNVEGNTVSVMLGNGDFTFKPRIDFGVSGFPSTMAVADFNGDGKPDIVVANYYSSTVSVLLNLSPAPAPLAVAFDFTPHTLDLASHGRWVTGYLEPSSPLAAKDIDVASIRLNGTVPVSAAAPTELGDHDANGLADLMVKFGRTPVELALSEGDSVPATITGTVGGKAFSGTDHIRVRRGSVSAPVAGSRLAAGSVAPVRWETPGAVTIASVALMLSTDGGGTWSTIGSGQPNTGSYDLIVPNVRTDQAKLAVLAESIGESGTVVEGVLGVSDAFAIAGGVTGVNDRGPSALAIRGARPNPTVGGHLRVEFALRDGSPARLELMDLAGRIVSTRQVGTLGPGRHTLDLSSGEVMRPGIYFLRLTQSGTEVRARVAVLQ